MRSNFLSSLLLGASLFAFTAVAPAMAESPAAGSSGTGAAASTGTGAAAGAASGAGAGSSSSSYSFSTPNPSSICCSKSEYDYGHANDNAKIMMGNTNQKLAAVQLAIIETLRLATGQLSGNSREQTGAQHTLADQQDDRSVVRAVEQHVLNAVNSAVTPPGACRTITATGGGGIKAGADQVAAAYNKEMLAWLDGSSDMSSKGQDDAVMKRLEMHCSKFATQQDVDSGVCKTAASSAMQNADLDPRKSLFANNGVVDALTEDQALAAQAYVMNTVAPVPFTPLSVEEAAGTEGRMRAQRQKTEMGRVALPAATMAEIISKNVGISKDSKLISWAKGTAANMQGFKDADYSKGVSHNDWLKLNSQSFFLNADEMKNAQESEITAIKQLVPILSVMAFQQYENYEVLQSINANLAMQTAILAEGTRTDLNFTSAPGKSSAGN